MNFKLLIPLSFLGLLMAIATVYIIPTTLEPYGWLGIMLVSAYLIAINNNEKYFLNGLVLGLMNAFWVTIIHIVLFNTYMINHPKEAEMMQTMPMPDSPRLMMLMVGPIIGILSGIVIGMFAWVGSKFVSASE